jgi:ribosomal protein L11 methyltransferase
MSVNLRQVAVVTNAGAEEAVGELLEREFGQVPSVLADMATGLSTVSVYRELVAAKVPKTRARLLLSLRGMATDGLDVSPGRIRIRAVPPQDWSESWKRHFKPIDLGPSLLVKPTWSRRKPRRGQAVVILDPGLSFGTGQHATTRFCLEQVAACRDGSAVQSFLDIGTGSGILAIAAAKLGYSPVAAFDFDPDCVRIAAANAELNQVTALVEPVLGDITRLPKRGAVRHDLVCANLIWDLLIGERDRILARVADGGSLVLAGILRTQFEAVQEAYAAAGWRMVKAKSEREWRSGLFRRAPGSIAAAKPRR